MTEEGKPQTPIAKSMDSGQPAQVPTFGKTIVEINKTVVFLGRMDKTKGPELFATGCLIQLNGATHLVTAKHVIQDRETGQRVDSEMATFYNLKSGTPGFRPIGEIKEKFGVDWIFHKNNEVDVAIIPYGTDLSTDDLLVVPNSLFITTEPLFQLYPVFFLSYQPGVRQESRISPIMRTGMISRINEDGTIYIDGAAFPGNSGSPAFLTPTLVRFDRPGFSIGPDPLAWKFLGIIGEYIPYTEIAVSLQTRKPRAIFEENTGLSRIWPFRYVQEITEQDDFIAQIEKIKPRDAKT